MRVPGTQISKRKLSDTRQARPDAGLGVSHFGGEREFAIDNLLVRNQYIIVMMRWTGLAPWESVFPFPGSLTSTFLRE